MNHSDLLVVDDDDATRTGLRQLLANAGFSVDVAQDGAEAMGKISSHDFRVVLLDVRLPTIGGLDILAHCGGKRRPPKVIIMTGSDTTEVMLDALRRHAYDFLAKPIEPSRLIEVVTRAFAAGSGVTTIEVISARADWVELLVPCTRDAAERIQSFVQQLEIDLPADTRDSVGVAFRELLLNGIEWGAARFSAESARCVSPNPPDVSISDRRSWPGFNFDDLSHAAVHSAPGILAHDDVRHEKGLRPGGFGLVLIRAIADELIYNEQQNEVVFVKIP